MRGILSIQMLQVKNNILIFFCFFLCLTKFLIIIELSALSLPQSLIRVSALIIVNFKTILMQCYRIISNLKCELNHKKAFKCNQFSFH